MPTRNELLKHAVKAIKYRFDKAILGSKEGFGDFKVSKDTRSPCEIINHMSDLAAKTKTWIREGHFNYPGPIPLAFEDEIARFLLALQELIAVMDEEEIDKETSKRLLQGPILDMATHVGQIAMLSGLNGNKIPKESYYNTNLE